MVEGVCGNLFVAFAVLAILSTCLGLLGLSALSTQQRTKEIGIRKVLGTSVPGIVNLLAKDFLILIAISILIAVPVAWMGMDKWLTEFAYRINIMVGVCIGSNYSPIGSFYNH